MLRSGSNAVNPQSTAEWGPAHFIHVGNRRFVFPLKVLCVSSFNWCCSGKGSRERSLWRNLASGRKKRYALFPHPLTPVSTSPNCRTGGVGLNSTLFHRAQKHTFIVLLKKRQLLTGFFQAVRERSNLKNSIFRPKFPCHIMYRPRCFSESAAR